MRQSIHVRPSKRIEKDYDFSWVENDTKKKNGQDFLLSVLPHSWKAISAQGKLYWPSRERERHASPKKAAL